MMGIRNAQYVSMNWADLQQGPYKLLMRIALYSLDESDDPRTPPRHYWRGWKDLAEALGRTPPADTDTTPEAARRRRTLQDEVRRHMNILVKQGAVQRAVDNPGRGTRQVWTLQLPDAYEL